MRIFLVLVGIFLNFALLAQQVEVEVSPNEALVNEPFYVTFKVKASGGNDPYISFDPVGAEVVGRREQGVSISTVVINGKFTTTREQSYVYELVAERAGTAFLKNIKVEINGKTEKAKDVKVVILNEKRKLQDVFLEAVPSKNKIYIGEGINVAYYLYYKIPVVANDIKEFPKLNKFIKRFYKTQGNIETVQYKGEVYRRVLAYSARAYPEKVGVAVLDQMKIAAQVADQRSFDPFGGLSSSYRPKDIVSPRVEIEVMPIPTEGMPSNFTGLVGAHDFILTGGKSKYLINEPIEFKLEVRGSGALENFQAPALFTSDLIEEFDTKADLIELSEGAASKKFDFTYLARSEVSIPEREVSFSYFDPENKKFVEKSIKIPALVVAGGVMDSSKENKPKAAKANNNQRQDLKLDFDMNFLPNWLTPPKKSSTKIGLVGIQDKLEKDFTGVIIKIVSLVIVLVSFLLIYFNYKKVESGEDVEAQFNTAFKKFKKTPSYEHLYTLLSIVFERKGADINRALKECSLPNEAKTYILQLLQSLEQGQFSKSKTSSNSKKIEYGYLKKLKIVIQEKNEVN
ncbi:MAG: BatD family protein [Bacteriovoracaceae bacterium]|nr:BatD family protein [Bacteriovoracaceae bacterium]